MKKTKSSKKIVLKITMSMTITKPFKRPARMQLASVSKIVATLQDSCEQRRRVRRLQRGCQGHSSLDAPSELNPLQRIPSPLLVAPLVPQAEG